MATVSVIVPNRDGGDQLLETLAHIVASLPSEAEVWLVDDGSTDGSGARAQVAFPQIRTLSIVPSRGAAFARNRGLEAAGGEYLLCVDADVTCPPACLPKLLDALRSADIVFPSLVSPSGELLSPLTPFVRQRCLNSAVFGVRRSALGRLDCLFDEVIEVYGEDNDFFLRAHRLGLVLHHVPEAEAVHPQRSLLGERHYYLTVRNAIYVYLKLRGLVTYWMPMDLWIAVFLGAQFLSAVGNSSFSTPKHSQTVRYTRRSRLHLLWLFLRALGWNLRHLRVALARRRIFRSFLAHADSRFQLA